MNAAASERAPWYILAPSVLVGAAVFLPLAYLVLRAAEADATQLQELVFRARNLQLLLNTVVLAAAVLVTDYLLALPLAWTLTRGDLRARPLFTLLAVLPLAIPGYVLAYALQGLTGANGTLAHLAGVTLPRPYGFFGAWTVLTLYTYPYVFLNLRAALVGQDPALEESARSLGARPPEVFRRVLLPQLRPALAASGLIVVLHVVGDFGVVALMRYETFSYALYLQYAAAYDRVYAAWLGLMLLGLTVPLVVGEARALARLNLQRTSRGAARAPRRLSLGRWRTPAYAGMIALAVVAVIAPVGAIAFWMARDFQSQQLHALVEALAGSMQAAAPAAVIAALLAVPIIYLGQRFPSWLSRALERSAYFAYAVPPLALALAFIFFTLRAVPGVYQTLGVLVAVYVLHFLAEALGPVRSALLSVSPRVEEAARSLGETRLGGLRRVVAPLIKRGVFLSALIVFLSALKELPITFLLSPVGYETLAVNVWSYTNEVMFAEAAPFAMALLLSSAALVAILLAQPGHDTAA